MITDVLLDLDGVLVDFCKPFCDFHCQPLTYSHKYHEDWGLPHDEIWSGVTSSFWEWLPWMHDGKTILQMVRRRFGEKNIGICTAAPSGVEAAAQAASGKTRWIAREVPELLRDSFIGASKFRAASPTRLLIDDNEKNVRLFKEAGGQAFLVPRIWNGSSANAVEALQLFLDEAP